MKKLFTLLMLLLCVGGGKMWASTVSDLKTIATDYVFIADNITANGTASLTANTLYDGNVIFAPTANTVATNKGNSSIEGINHLNSLRLKKTQDQLCFKVLGACTVTFYTQSHNSRGINVGSAAGGTQYGQQTASTTEWSCNITAAGVVYLSSYEGDFYFAGFKVTFPKTGQPTISTNPVSAEYNQGAAATALSVSATAANSGALSYQWYKNETCQSVLAGEGATEIDGATNSTYTPSTAAAGTTYYFCKVTEEGNANVATTRMAKVLVNPAGYNVTYSLGEVTGTVGTLPEGASHVTSVTIPVNKTLYKAGYTLTAWNDGAADHAIGSTFAITANTTLTPVFSANGASTYLGHNASEVTWDFQTKNGAPTITLEGAGQTGILVTQAKIGGNTMDVKLDIDATSGKFNNANNNDWAQTRPETKLTVPVLTGATIQLYVYEEGTTAVTFDGNDGTFSSNIYSYTATSDGDLDIVIKDQGYSRYLKVTYPSETAVLTVSAANTTVGLTQAIINSVDYLAVATDNWSDQTIGDYSGKFYNMSSTSRNLTIKVTGASRFEVYVKNSTKNRTYKVKVGSADAQIITHGGTGVESSGVFAIADPSAETTITLSGNGDSVYPGYVVFDPAAPVTVGAKGYATYTNSTYALDFTGKSIKAYTISSTDGSALALTQKNKVAKNEPVLLYSSTNSDSQTIPAIPESEATATEGNKLVAGDGAAHTWEEDITEHYILYTGGATPGFWQANNSVVAVGKAYLDLTGLSATARSFNLNIEDGETTGISQMENGNSRMDNSLYDLQGRRVAQPAKGLYIVNGKKVVVK